MKPGFRNNGPACRPAGGLAALALLGALVGGSFRAPAAEAVPSVDAWLAAQAHLMTWSAEVVQTRRLATVTQPLVSTGRVWFVAPNRFRWELGSPAATIAVRQPEQLLVIYPRLRRVERYGLDGVGAGPWGGTLALLEAGFPRSRAELEARFRVVGQERTNAAWRLTLQPREASARRWLAHVQVELAVEGLALQATSLQFADGSSLRNEFRQPVRNAPVAADLLEPVLDPGFERVEPLRRPVRP